MWAGERPANLAPDRRKAARRRACPAAGNGPRRGAPDGCRPARASGLCRPLLRRGGPASGLMRAAAFLFLMRALAGIADARAAAEARWPLVWSDAFEGPAIGRGNWDFDVCCWGGGTTIGREAGRVSERQVV